MFMEMSLSSSGRMLKPYFSRERRRSLDRSSLFDTSTSFRRSLSRNWTACLRSLFSLTERCSWLINNNSQLYEPQLCYFSGAVLMHIREHFVHLKAVKEIRHTIITNTRCDSTAALASKDFPDQTAFVILVFGLCIFSICITSVALINIVLTLKSHVAIICAVSNVVTLPFNIEHGT